MERMKMPSDLLSPSLPAKGIVVLGWILVATVAPRSQTGSRDYPQWRGQQRDGAASAFAEPAAWPDTLTRQWKVDVGEGYATPIVVGDVVYVFTRRDGNEVMAALDANTGKERWRSGYAAPYSASQPAAAHGAGPKATPVLHDGMVISVGVSGIVAAFDAATGRLAWQSPAPAEPPFFGAGASPAAEAGLVVAHPGDYGPLTAYDVRSGAIKWTAGDDGFFASPLLVTLGGIRQVVTVTQTAIIGVGLADGRVLWRYAWRGGSGGTMPILYDDTIIVSGLDLGAIAIKPVSRGGEWVVSMVWETRDVSMYLSNPVVIGDALFGLSHRSSGQFFALDARSGKTLWLGQPREAINTAVVKAGDLLFLLNDDAELIVARSSRTAFTPIKRYTVADAATWAQPAISGNRIFVKDAATLALWTVR
jgi:outer membrane protein assembly factor BamB